MANRGWRLFKNCVAPLSAALMLALPQPASAQWWGEEEAYDDEIDYKDRVTYGDGLYGYGEGLEIGEGMVRLGKEQDGGEDAIESSFSRYYAEDFEDEVEWGDWFHSEVEYDGS